MQRNPICQRYLGGVIVNDGTAQFSVRTVCAKEYVDAVNTTVNELKEKYIFRFEKFDKAQISRVGGDGSNAIYVDSPVPQGYERMLVVTSSSGIATLFMYGGVLSDDKTSDTLTLWMANAFDANTANGIWNALYQLGVFTIFVKKG